LTGLQRPVAPSARNGFDILVSDIGLPDGTGQELVARLCSGRSVPAIALIGYGTRADVERRPARRLSPPSDEPVEPDQLIAAIESVTDPERARARGRL
jgi:CheY-like chemotaxis protein